VWVIDCDRPQHQHYHNVLRTGSKRSWGRWEHPVCRRAGYGDPLFCAPAPCEESPTTNGMYSLMAESPCLPEHSPCGELIGALGVGCLGGPCCAIDGGCTMTTQANCSGVWTVGGSCDPNPCPPPSACCIYLACEIYDQATCVAHGGCYQGIGTLCEPDPCPTSALGGAPTTVTRLQVLTAPNPSAGGVVIRCLLPTRAQTTVVLFDASGRMVRRLQGGDLPAGVIPLSWDGRDDAGRAVPTGLYLVRITTPAGEASGRVVLTR
jgi:hypothetical protein